MRDRKRLEELDRLIEAASMATAPASWLGECLAHCRAEVKRLLTLERAGDDVVVRAIDEAEMTLQLCVVERWPLPGRILDGVRAHSVREALEARRGGERELEE